jgi:hypothetical protein
VLLHTMPTSMLAHGSTTAANITHTGWDVQLLCACLDPDEELGAAIRTAAVAAALPVVAHMVANTALQQWVKARLQSPLLVGHPWLVADSEPELLAVAVHAWGIYMALAPSSLLESESGSKIVNKQTNALVNATARSASIRVRTAAAESLQLFCQHCVAHVAPDKQHRVATMAVECSRCVVCALT